MNRPALIVLVRHAESERNKAKQGKVYFANDDERRAIKGIPDQNIQITEEGRKIAELTGIAIRKKFGAFDYAYHSGYARTLQTLEAILAAYTEEEMGKIAVRHNPFIRERDPGYAYDMTEKEAKKTFPWMHEYWETFGGFFSRPIGGESLADVVQRVYLFLNMLFRDRAGKRVLVVTHGGTLRCFRFLLERWNYEQALHWPEGQAAENCGVTAYEFDESEQRLVLREYNTVYA